MKKNGKLYKKTMAQLQWDNVIPMNAWSHP